MALVKKSALFDNRMHEYSCNLVEKIYNQEFSSLFMYYTIPLCALSRRFVLASKETVIKYEIHGTPREFAFTREQPCKTQVFHVIQIFDCNSHT